MYAEPLWRNISRLVGSDSAVVADIVQETFLAAARSAKNFDPHRGSLWVWLWTIAKRQVAQYYRKQKPNILLSQAQHWWTALNGETFDWIDTKVDMPQARLRLLSRSKGQLGLGVDIEYPGDMVVEHDGTEVLIVEHELAYRLNGVTLDIEETPEGPELVVCVSF